MSEILEAAETVFAEDGYSAFSLRRVAALAGLRLSTLQHYFATHEDLRLATVDSLLGRYPMRYRAFLEDESKPPRHRLEALVEDALDAVADARVRASLFQASALAMHDRAVARRVEAHYAAYTAIIAEMLRLNNLNLSLDDSVVRAALLASQIEGLTFLGSATRARSKRWRRLRAIVKTRVMELADS